MVRAVEWLAIVLLFASEAIAQPIAGPIMPSAIEGQQGFVINLRDGEIQALAEQVSMITGRTLILDPAVRGQVTVISAEPLDADGVWTLFQSVLRVYGFAVLQTGPVWRVVPQATTNQGAALERVAGSTQDLVTRLIRLRNLSSADAARVLKPLVASFGYLEAVPSPNAIIITDYADNVRRVQDLALMLDSGDGTASDSITLQNAPAKDVAQTIERIVSTPQSGGTSSGGTRIAVDERSNTILVRASPQTLAEIRRLATSLDQPSGVTAQAVRVFRLNNGDAEELSEILRGLIGEETPVTNPVARSLATPAPYAAPLGLGAIGTVALGSPAIGAANVFGSTMGNIGVPSGFGPAAVVPALSGGQSDRAAGSPSFRNSGIAVQPAPGLNAIVVRGTPAAIAEVEALITALDVRRPQVLIEAAIVEITGNVTEQFGIQLGVGDAVPVTGFGATSFSTAGLPLRTILAALGGPASAVLNEGLSAGFSSGDFGVLVQALAQLSRANLLSTPSLTTLDNQPAQIVVGQNVPFRTGSFATQGNVISPFTTIQRQDVGITMRVVPRIHEGDVIRLEVSQEVSSLVNANIAGAADLITNRRTIQTTVLADNAQTIVLGGLITDDRISSENKVPVLGDIPVVGTLFGAQSQNRTKRTLFVFLRATIMRDKQDAISAARGKYQRLLDLERAPQQERSLLLQRAPPKLPLEIEGIY